MPRLNRHLLLENWRWSEGMATPNTSPQNVLIGGPVPAPGFPLKACGNDGIRGKNCNGGEANTSPFSFSVGERKIMNHFVLTSGTSLIDAAASSNRSSGSTSSP